MKKLLILSAFLTACAVNPEPFIGPDGKQSYYMRCSGAGRSIPQCFQKAGELCPQGYTIIDRSSSTVGVPVNGSVMMAPRQEMAIQCK
jgi:hypothetical protein